MDVLELGTLRYRTVSGAQDASEVMAVCMHIACMYVNACKVRMYACMSVRMFVITHVCTYVCL